MRLSVRARRHMVAAFSLGVLIVSPAALAVSHATGALVATASTPASDPRTQHNLIIFIADGLRHDSVNRTDAPTLLALRERGVHFSNSHSLYPTLTTANASAIATGHYLGDTGDFSNAEYVGYPSFNHGLFGKATGSPTPFLENDLVLGDVTDHASTGNFLNEVSLLALARAHGFNTAAIGKLGPVAIQDITQLKPADGHFAVPTTVILDDSTGSPAGVPVAADVQSALAAAGLDSKPTPREQPTGTAFIPGALAANVGQQKWFADAATKAVLPAFVRSGRPFVLLFWSRDPDGSQHNQGDSLGKLQPGINGPTSRAGVSNADSNLKQLLDYLAANPAVNAVTDVFVTSDHGFSTISRQEIDATGRPTHSYAASFSYLTSEGKPEMPQGWLPPGFLAIDLAHALNLPLFDADSQVEAAGDARYEPVDPGKQGAARQHPVLGDALLGGSGLVQDQLDTQVLVAAGGGSDLIYVANDDRDLARKIVDVLVRQDYVGGIFVARDLGRIPGTLPMESVALEGSAQMPHPSMVVTFKSFELNHGSLLSAVQISDTPLQEGQGMHGGFGRDNTFNNMAAVGPDFKQRFEDPLPVSNADIAPTLARVLGLEFPAGGSLKGRVLEEALRGGPAAGATRRRKLSSGVTSTGLATVLEYQEYAGHRYFDRACFIHLPGGTPTTGCR
jgi:arylsulfatase A-like enzyme